MSTFTKGSFFRQGGYSDSEESSSSNDDNLDLQKRKFSESSDDEADEKRVARSQRDKRLDEIRGLVRSINNHKKINDMGNVLTDFEDLTRAYDRVAKVIDMTKEKVPPLFIRCLAELEDYVNEAWEKKKTMNKLNAKNMATLRQRIKKYNRDFETNITDFRANPEKYEEDVVVEEKEEEVVVKPKGKLKAAKFLESSSSSSGDDTSDWGSSSDSDTTSSDDDPENYANNPAARFLKKTDTDKAPKEKRKDKPAAQQRKIQKPLAPAANRASDEESESALSGDDGYAKVGKKTTVKPSREAKSQIFVEGEEITAELVVKKLKEIMADRGKKKTDRKDQVNRLEEIVNLVEVHPLMTPGVQVRASFCLLAVLFDKTSAAVPMKMDLWKRIAKRMGLTLDLLEKHLHDLDVDVTLDDEKESLLVAPFRVKACVLTLIERLDDELTQILQNSDSHGNEYVERLQEEKTICKLIESMCNYQEKVNELMDERGCEEKDQVNRKEMLCRAYIRRMEHMYHKFDYEWARSISEEELILYGAEDEDADWASSTQAQTMPPSPPRLYEAESTKLMTRLCTYIANHDTTDRLRARAILCFVYFLALHDDWNKAKQHLLMSSLQAKIDSADISTKILYNRTMVQMGLCAFRRGQLREAHMALVEMLSLNRVRELLAQGISSQQQRNQFQPERSAEQELLERRRMMPYHMFINMELIECVYHVSAMFIETPYIAASDMDMRRRHISKHFHRALKQSESNNLNGPPETMRDHIVCATKAMRYGDWERALTSLVNDKMNVKVWDLFFHSNRIKAMLKRKVKEESLRCYLLSFSSIYDSISLQLLSQMFTLSMAVVNSIVCKLINKENKDEYSIKGSLDEPTQSLVMHRGEPSRVHGFCLQIADKLSSLQESVERYNELKCQGALSQSGGGGGGGTSSTAISMTRANAGFSLTRA